jgi:hypothetical protein
VPTFGTTPTFDRAFEALSSEQKTRFKRKARDLSDDLKAGGKPRKGLRVKGYKSRQGTLEMTWAPNGRAVFMFGEAVREGEPHVIWLDVGSHDIL